MTIVTINSYNSLFFYPSSSSSSKSLFFGIFEGNVCTNMTFSNYENSNSDNHATSLLIIDPYFIRELVCDSGGAHIG